MSVTARSSTPRRWTRRLIAAGLLLGVGLAIYRHFDNGGPAHRLMDTEASGGSIPRVLRDINGTLFFSANDGRHGRELWTSDGTAAGTSMVKDIDPDPNGWGLVSTEPVGVAGTVFFVQDDGEHGNELWKTDGSGDGTVLVKDIQPGSEASWPGALLDAGGSLLFTADDGTHGRELWTSDGTTAGTVMVKDIWQGSRGTGDERHLAASHAKPRWFTSAAGRTYFSAGDRTHGVELWTSDGTSAGTEMVRDILPGRADSDPRALIEMGGTLYFTANGGAHGRGLWRSDGTAAGTSLVKDAGRGSVSGPQDLTLSDRSVFFFIQGGTEGDQFWRSDGTPAGTVLVKVVNEGAPDARLSSLTAVDGKVFFVAVRPDGGPQLWRSDGTEGGTGLVTELPGGPPATPPESLTEAGGLLYFVLREMDHEPWDAELWRSDGTVAGTFQVQDIVRGDHGSAPLELTVVGDRLFFATANADAGLWALPIRA